MISSNWSCLRWQIWWWVGNQRSWFVPSSMALDGCYQDSPEELLYWATSSVCWPNCCTDLLEVMRPPMCLFYQVLMFRYGQHVKDCTWALCSGNLYVMFVWATVCQLSGETSLFYCVLLSYTGICEDFRCFSNLIISHSSEILQIRCVKRAACWLKPVCQRVRSSPQDEITKCENDKE